jgi:hypothetical protein
MNNNNLYPSLNAKNMKSRRVKWEKHIKLMWEMRNAYKILVLKLKKSDLS